MRYKRLIERVEKQVDRTLDIRTMLKMQSVMLAIVRVLFQPGHYPLLRMQRGGQLLDLEHKVDGAEQLIYGTDNDAGVKR